MVESARLESVYRLIAYRGFESLSHRHYYKNKQRQTHTSVILLLKLSYLSSNLRKSLRKILPTLDFGSSSINSITRGRL